MGAGDTIHSLTMQITLNRPEDVVEGLATKWEDLPRAALESLALEGYRAGALTHAQVRRLLRFAACSTWSAWPSVL